MAISSSACLAAGAPSHPAPVSNNRMSDVSMMHVLCHRTIQFGFIDVNSGPYDFMTWITSDFVCLARGSKSYVRAGTKYCSSARR